MSNKNISKRLLTKRCHEDCGDLDNWKYVRRWDEVLRRACRFNPDRVHEPETQDP